MKLSQNPFSAKHPQVFHMQETRPDLSPFSLHLPKSTFSGINQNFGPLVPPLESESQITYWRMPWVVLQEPHPHKTENCWLSSTTVMQTPRLRGTAQQGWWSEILKYHFVTLAPTNRKMPRSWSHIEDPYPQVHPVKPISGQRVLFFAAQIACSPLFSILQ